MDHDTLVDNTVTVRYRDTMAQDRVPVEKLHQIIADQVNINNLLRKNIE